LPNLLEITKINVYGWGKHAEDNYKIFSDFQQSSYNVDKNRNEIKAEYTINGGGAKIYLRTTNSNIKIQKSN